MARDDDRVQALLNGPVLVVNIGLETFSSVLRSRDIAVVHLDWAPPAGGDARLIALLDKLGA